MNATRLVALAVALVLASKAPAENVDPDGDGSQFAWSENLGFVNLEPGGDGADGVTVRDDALTGWAWSENAGWISLSCGNTGTCATVDYGVTNDGAGRLSGFAWGENVGWIAFACYATASCATVDYGVTIDPATGLFSGIAWSENAGWIDFGAPGLVVRTSWRPASVPCEEPSALDLRPGAVPLTLRKGIVPSLLQLRFEGGPSGLRSIYQGTLASLRRSRFYDHASIGAWACGFAGDSAVIPMPPSDVYYLVVASCPSGESSYGRDSRGTERPAASPRCP